MRLCIARLQFVKIICSHFYPYYGPKTTIFEPNIFHLSGKFGFLWINGFQSESNQGRLKIWTSHSHWFLLSLEPVEISLQKFQHSYNSWKYGFWQNLEGVAQKLNLPRPFDVFDGFGGKSKFLCTYNLHIWYKAGSHRVWQLVKIWWWYLKPSLRNSKLTVLSFQSIPQEVIK